MAQYIDVIGTERFHNNWGRTDPDTHLEDVRDWCESVWEDDIEDGSGDYEASWFYWTSTEIPESELCSDFDNCDLADRRDDAVEWLEENWSAWDSSTAGVVLDYFDGEGGSMGLARLSAAGRTSRKFGIVDTYYHDAGYLDSGFHEDTQSEGTSQHEVGHLYGAHHEDGTVYSTNNVTLIVTPSVYDDYEPQCIDNGDDTEKRRGWHTNCVIDIVRDHICEYVNDCG